MGFYITFNSNVTTIVIQTVFSELKKKLNLIQKSLWKVIGAVIIGILVIFIIVYCKKKNTAKSRQLRSIKEAVNQDNTRKMGGRPQQKFDEFLYNLQRESESGKKLANDLKARYVDISCIHPTWDFDNLRRLGGGAFGDAYLAEIDTGGMTRTAVIKVSLVKNWRKLKKKSFEKFIEKNRVYYCRSDTVYVFL